MMKVLTAVVFAIAALLLMMIYDPDNTGSVWADGSSKGWARLNTAIARKVNHKLVATKLQFYFHDKNSGDSPTVFQVARLLGNTRNDTSALTFGNLFMFDAPLTVGPDRNSELVGRAQGMYASDSREDVAVFMSMSFTFTKGIYNDSSITIVGHNPITHLKRELPVLGGTGIFRLSRGYALPLAYMSDLVTGNAIVGYNVTVFHYLQQPFDEF